VPGRPKRDEKRKDRRSRIYSARSPSDSVAGGSTRTAAYAVAAGLLPPFSTSSSFREVSLTAVLRKRARQKEGDGGSTTRRMRDACTGASEPSTVSNGSDLNHYRNTELP